MGVSRGFTLVEVVVSLLIIATGLIILLVTIQGGLTHLRTSRLELESCLEVQSAAGLFALGVAMPGMVSWRELETIGYPDLPGLEMVRLELGEGRDAYRIWVARRREEGARQ